VSSLSLETLRLSRKKERNSRNLLDCKKKQEFLEALSHSTQATLASNKKMR
jgi:hypothetical protein